MSTSLKIDWVTLSLLRGTSSASVNLSLDTVFKSLCLDSIASDFDYIGSSSKYEMIYSYQGIKVSVPFTSRFIASDNKKSGIIVEFSGSGLDFYRAFLANVGKELRTVFSSFRALSVLGYTTKCNRLDLAFDDRCSGNSRPLLSLDIIEESLRSGAFVSKFRRGNPDVSSGAFKSVFTVDPQSIDSDLPYSIVISRNFSSGREGKTIYLGKRNSNSFVRIYDKLAEQEIKGKKDELEGVSSWVRFEIEFHRTNACSVFSRFCDSSDDKDFAAFCSRCCFDLIRFVDLDHSRKYNCSVSDWYIDFLGKISEDGMYIDRMSANQYLKTVKYVNSNLAAILSALVLCDSAQFESLLVGGATRPSKTSRRILQDFKSYSALSVSDREHLRSDIYSSRDGVEFWSMFTPEDPDAFRARLYSSARSSGLIE